MAAPIASGRSDLAGWVSHQLEKRRLSTAHTNNGRSRMTALFRVRRAVWPSKQTSGWGMRCIYTHPIFDSAALYDVKSTWSISTDSALICGNPSSFDPIGKSEIGTI